MFNNSGNGSLCKYAIISEKIKEIVQVIAEL